jgi:hypothetical protein
MSQEHSQVMIQLAAQGEKESNRPASAEGAYRDLKEHCRTLEAMIQANQQELNHQTMAVEDRWRQVVLDTEQAMGQRAALSDRDLRNRLDEAERMLAIERARNVSQGTLSGATTTQHGQQSQFGMSPSNRGQTGDPETMSVHSFSLNQEGHYLGKNHHVMDYAQMFPQAGDSQMLRRVPSTLHLEHDYRANASQEVPLPRQQMEYVNRANASRDVPLPRQLLFNGKSKWESFICQFKMLSTSCGWNESEKLFRLSSSLRDDAADYAFCQLGSDVSGSYDLLLGALESRFKERKSVSSYLSQLEARKLQPKEDVSQYVADLRHLVVKGYRTADESTRESIVCHHFINGLGDPKASTHVGMTRPHSVEEAQDALEMYNSLQNDAIRPPRVRAVNISTDEDIPITKFHLMKLSEDLRKEISGLKASFRTKASSKPRRDLKDVECFGCHEMGHYSKFCPKKPSRLEGDSQPSSTNSTTQSEN